MPARGIRTAMSGEAALQPAFLRRRPSPAARSRNPANSRAEPRAPQLVRGKEQELIRA